LLGWLAVILNDWHESLFTHPKGSLYLLILLGSLPSLAIGIAFAVRARRLLVDDVRERIEADGVAPSPREVLMLGIRRGFGAVKWNLWAYFAFFFSHPARVVAGFLLAAVVGGAWLARSVILREYPERISRPYATLMLVPPAALLAALTTSVSLVVTRMSLDGAVEWAFDSIAWCGGVETANATLVLLPAALVGGGGGALLLLLRQGLGAWKGGPARRGRGADRPALRRVQQAIAGALFVAAGGVAFAGVTLGIVVASPPRACRNTPYDSQVAAILHHAPASFLHRTLASSGALGGVAGSLFLLLAARRGVPTEEEARTASRLGPYRETELGPTNARI